ncbi:uncharacterized protein LOC144162767 isoform X1 [Haemaphysalis longicornis]
MTPNHLQVALTYGLVLLASAFAKNTRHPEKLHVDGDVQSSYSYKDADLEIGEGLGKGILAAIIIFVLIVGIGVIVCCICLVRACARRKEEHHAVVYAGSPAEDQPRLQIPPQHSQEQPAAHLPPQDFSQPPPDSSEPQPVPLKRDY